MASKIVTVEGLGPVQLYKRKNARALRLSITHKGEIRVSMPYWVPYSAAAEYVKTKQAWIQAKRVTAEPLFNGMKIGKAHHLRFVQQADKKGASSRITKQGEVLITFSSGMTTHDDAVQASAERASIRALKQQAGQLLPSRVASLAKAHGFSYKEVKIQRLSSRWGSCSSDKTITLNCYLMQLPWHLIDYVIMHELMHTQIMAHGPKFWDNLAHYVPNLAATRKEIRSRRPILHVMDITR